MAWRPPGGNNSRSDTRHIIVLATGPCLDKPIAAGSGDAWFELLPAPGQTCGRFDTSKETFVVHVTRERQRGSASDRPGNKTSVDFSGMSPDPDRNRPHGSIHVLLASLHVAGTYFMSVMRVAEHIRGSPFTIVVAPGPPAELRILGKRGSTAERDGGDVQEVAMIAGEECSTLLRTYDACGNTCGGGGAYLEVQLKDRRTVSCSIKDQRNGGTKRHSPSSFDLCSATPPLFSTSAASLLCVFCLSSAPLFCTLLCIKPRQSSH